MTFLPDKKNPSKKNSLYKNLSFLLLLITILYGLAEVWPELPQELTVTELRPWIHNHGVLGITGFGAFYVMSTLLLIPAAALTLVAGAIFGLKWGLIIVSIASSIADGAAFLIGRYFARDVVSRVANRYRPFGALDSAITEGGWKVVALLRLSPTIPYSASNYLYGLTGIRFLPYWITTWAFTLPGTFAYVYLGYVGAETISQEQKSTIEWTLLFIGLITTLVATVYLALLSRRALSRMPRKNHLPSEPNRSY